MPTFPGYVNNKKGFVVSRSTNYDVAYVLEQREDAIGKRLVITTHKKNTNDINYTLKHQTIYPIIPYRIPSGSVSNFNAIIRETNPAATIPLFNPGLTYNTTTNEIEGGPSTIYWIAELNLTRNQIAMAYGNPLLVAESVINPSTTVYYKNNAAFYLEESNASILVKSIDDNTDKIILSVVTKLSYSIGVLKIHYATYTIPWILTYEVNRTSPSSCIDLLPTAWAYGVASSNEPFELYKINESITGTINDTHWNYNFIPGTYITEGSARYWMPIDYGSLIDSVSNDADLVTTSSFTYKREDNRWYTKVSSFRFSDIFNASGFIQEDKIIKYKDSNSYNVPNTITSSYNNGVYLSCVSLTSTSLGDYHEFIHGFIIAIDATTFDVTMKCLLSSHGLTSDFYKNGFILGFINNNTFKVYDIGDASTLIARIDSGPEEITADQLEDLWSVSNIYSKSGYNSLISENTVYRTPINITYILALSGANSILYYINNNNQPCTVSIISTISKFLNKTGLVINSNTSSEKLAILSVSENNINSIIDQGSNIKIGSTASFAYDSTDNTNPDDGVDILLEIQDCSGVFSVGDWSDSIGGVEIDQTKTRLDFQFEYDGVKSDFIATGNYGYWANLIYPTPKVELYHGTINKVLISEFKGMSFAKYDPTGNCIIQVGLVLKNLPPDLLGKTYDEEGYSLTNISAELTIPTVDGISGLITGITYTPPSPSVTITVASQKVASQYTTISYSKTNPLSKVEPMVLHEIHNKEDNPTSLTEIQNLLNIDTAVLSANKSLKLSKCEKGDYFFIKWIEYLNAKAIEKTSGLKSFVKGHRYLLEQPYPRIFVDSLDKTDEIFNGDYVYVNPTAGSVDVMVSGFSLNHEDFNSRDRDEDNVPSDSTRYPIISEVYLFAVQKQNWPNQSSYKSTIISYEESVPTGAPITYPNGTSFFYSKLYALAQSPLGFNATNVYGSPTISVTDNITVTITSCGVYQLFLVVKDEFSQYSIFHITSKDMYNGSKTYRTQFAGGI